MNFWVKLIAVKETHDQEARDSLNANCTHVAGDLWLFEGDETSLDPGLDFTIVDEQAIESYGDDSGSNLKKMVCETYFLTGEQRLLLGCSGT